MVKEQRAGERISARALKNRRADAEDCGAKTSCAGFMSDLKVRPPTKDGMPRPVRPGVDRMTLRDTPQVTRKVPSEDPRVTSTCVRRAGTWGTRKSSSPLTSEPPAQSVRVLHLSSRVVGGDQLPDLLDRPRHAAEVNDRMAVRAHWTQ